MQPLPSQFSHCTNCSLTMPLNLYFGKISTKDDWRWKAENFAKKTPCPVCNGQVEINERFVNAFEDKAEMELCSFSFYSHLMTLDKTTLNRHFEHNLHYTYWRECEAKELIKSRSSEKAKQLWTELVDMGLSETTDLSSYNNRLDEIADSLLKAGVVAPFRPYLLAAVENSHAVENRLRTKIREEREALRERRQKASNERQEQYRKARKIELEAELPVCIKDLVVVAKDISAGSEYIGKKIDNATKIIEKLGLTKDYQSEVKAAEEAYQVAWERENKELFTPIDIPVAEPISCDEIKFRKSQPRNVQDALKLLDELRRNEIHDIDTLDRLLDDIADALESAQLIEKYDKKLCHVADHLTKSL